MKILYGTGNESKYTTMQRLFQSLGIELINLNHMDTPAPEVEENGRDPLENARLKAHAYYQTYHMPVFSCDSGLYLDQVPKELQPGVHVRVVNGKRLNDDEMIEYYSGLAQKYGDLTARYWNAICFIMDSEHIYESMEDDLSGERFIITCRPHAKRKNGFPLDSLSVHMDSGQYYFDIGHDAVDENVLENAFRSFFLRCLPAGRQG